MSYLKLL